MPCLSPSDAGLLEAETVALVNEQIGGHLERVREEGWGEGRTLYDLRSVFFFFFFWPHLWHVEFPRPGIKPSLQQ